MEINKTIDAVQEAQQKEYKRIKDAMKADIKKLSVEQAGVKLQRKTVNYPNTGCRKINSDMANATAAVKGKELRHLFIAYAMHRITATMRSIPEQHYTLTFNDAGKPVRFVRRDGIPIRNNENAPDMKLVIKLLEKYETGKTVHLSQV